MIQDVLQEFYSWLDSVSTLTFFLATGAVMWVIKLVAGFAKKSIPSVKSGIAFFEALAKLPQFMTDTSESLKEVRHEVLPNSGGSLRDKADMIDLQLEKIIIDQEQLQRHDANDLARLKRIEDELNIRRSAETRVRGQRVASGSIDLNPPFPSQNTEE